MKKRIETFYELNEQEKQILAERYGKPNPENLSFEPNVEKKDDPNIKLVGHSIANTKITINPVSFVYDGTEKEPNVVVTDGDTVLSTSNYSVDYTSNKNAGTGRIIVTGKGNYTGILNGTFEIKPKSISNATLTVFPASFKYDGTEKRPDVKVTLGNTVISQNVYDVAYSSNLNVGTGTVTVTGKGNYTGTLKENFEITKSSVESIESLYAWIWGAVILTAVITCGILFSHCNSGSEEPAVSSQISQISLQSDTDTVSSKAVSENSEKSENSVKTSSRESSVNSDESSKESSSESSKESSYESSVNPQESSFDVTSVEEPHQPSVESSEPSVITETSVYVPSSESSEPSVKESPEAVDSNGAPGDILTTGTCGENLKYTFNTVNGTLTITETGDMFEDFDSFQSNNGIKTVSIGSNVTGIFDNAFEGCNNLETVTMADDSKTQIGSNAFKDCTSLRNVHLSANLKKLGSYAFKGCTALEAITIPDTVTEIYDYTFGGCTTLKEVHLSRNIAKIDDDAFIDCNMNILTIYAPKGSEAETYAKKHNIKFVAEGAAV